MRAGRLISLMLILERRGRVTAARLAAELEVSERTVLRDIDELTAAGVPIVATRGPGGGFALGEGAAPPVSGAPGCEPGRHGSRRRQRAIVRITPEGVRLAAMLRRLQPLKVRRRNGSTVQGGWRPPSRSARSTRRRWTCSPAGRASRWWLRSGNGTPSRPAPSRRHRSIRIVSPATDRVEVTPRRAWRRR